jgi:hypothetical protein
VNAEGPKTNQTKTKTNRKEEAIETRSAVRALTRRGRTTA